MWSRCRSISSGQIAKNVALKIGYIGSHIWICRIRFRFNNLDLQRGFLRWVQAGLSKVVANPFYGVAGVPTSVSCSGTSTTLAQSNLLTKYPEYTSVSLSSPMGRAFYCLDLR